MSISLRQVGILYGIQATARKLGITKATLYKWVEEGLITPERYIEFDRKSGPARMPVFSQVEIERLHVEELKQQRRKRRPTSRIGGAA